MFILCSYTLKTCYSVIGIPNSLFIYPYSYYIMSQRAFQYNDIISKTFSFKTYNLLVGISDYT